MHHKPTRILLWLGLGCLLSISVFLFWNIRGNPGFVIPFRLKKILIMSLVACAISTATVLFQTISANRILTPGVMGFDALFLMLKTLLMLLMGAIHMGSLSTPVSFILNVAVMALFSTLLYRRLFTGSQQSLHLMILTGVVLGSLFRSLTSFFQSLIDPNEFLLLQNSLFANFNNPNATTLWIGLVSLGICGVIVARRCHHYDVVALGRDTAISLGITYQRSITHTLILIAVLVSVSTSLVGPVTFFGLLVSHLAYRLLPTHRHAVVLPTAAMIAVSALLVGQFILEHFLDFGTALSMIIEFAGGIVFLGLLLRGATR